MTSSGGRWRSRGSPGGLRRADKSTAKAVGPWTDGMEPPIGLPFGDPAAQTTGAGFLPTLPAIPWPRLPSLPNVHASGDRRPVAVGHRLRDAPARPDGRPVTIVMSLVAQVLHIALMIAAAPRARPARRHGWTRACPAEPGRRCCRNGVTLSDCPARPCRTARMSPPCRASHPPSPWAPRWPLPPWCLPSPSAWRCRRWPTCWSSSPCGHRPGRHRPCVARPPRPAARLRPTRRQCPRRPGRTGVHARHGRAGADGRYLQPRPRHRPAARGRSVAGSRVRGDADRAACLAARRHQPAGRGRRRGVGGR